MIARLSGILAELTGDGAVIDVAGVGYQLLCSARTLDAIGPIGGEVLILTELQVREDAWTLFGFGSAVERDSFRALTSVQGVGGRLALAILSVLSPDELAVTVKLRRVLHALEPQQAIDLLLDRLRKTRTNTEFLMQIAKTTPGSD